MEDQIAISSIKQGDPGGLEALVIGYQIQAVYTAYMIVFDRSLADDIAQTAFVRVVEKIQQFDETRPFAPWFFRIVVNEAVRIARQQNCFSGRKWRMGLCALEPTHVGRRWV